MTKFLCVCCCPSDKGGTDVKVYFDRSEFLSSVFGRTLYSHFEAKMLDNGIIPIKVTYFDGMMSFITFCEPVEKHDPSVIINDDHHFTGTASTLYKYYTDKCNTNGVEDRIRYNKIESGFMDCYYYIGMLLLGKEQYGAWYNNMYEFHTDYADFKVGDPADLFNAIDSGFLTLTKIKRYCNSSDGCEMFSQDMPDKIQVYKIENEKEFASNYFGYSDFVPSQQEEDEYYM